MMRETVKDIFRAIFLDKWVSIEYRNKNNEITKYWIGIKDIQMGENIYLIVDGLHIGMGSVLELRIDLKAICFSNVLEGTYYQVRKELKEDIENNPEKYQTLFNNVSNLKILNYLFDCHRLDNVPYKKEYTLISKIDDDKVKCGDYSLTDEQYKELIKKFQAKAKNNNKKVLTQLCLNVLSINTKAGIYVMAYRKLNFDVVNKCFMADSYVTICTEFNVNGDVVKSIRHFIDSEDLYLLEDFENNLSIIEDKIDARYSVDDMPYILAISRDNNVSLESEYGFIEQMYQDNSVSIPIKAFFGQLVKLPAKRRNYPLALINKKINLDQLLAIYNALRYPITYVQGPPGTGKTNTIINTILTSFFNEQLLLFSSYNNHPIDTVLEKLLCIKVNEYVIPFPILRIGNNDKMNETLNHIQKMSDYCANITIKKKELDNSIKNNNKKLSELLRKYEEIIELNERKETIEKLLESNNDFNFQITLQSKQLNDIKVKLEKLGNITDEDALELVNNHEDIKEYLFYKAVEKIKKLNDEKYDDLMKIVKMEESEARATSFNQYVSKSENLALLLEVFPIVAATCISAHKLGEADVYFDIVVIDEASQCNMAVALMPILRGRNLLLVGDPQQLNPVIQLDEKDNEILKKKYNINKEYDYLTNSIYKTYLAADSLSNEILLSHHYRCDKKIIDFCNKKYYNNRLCIDTISEANKPLLFLDVKDNESTLKNMSPREVDIIVEYVKKHPDSSIGVITPFVNQKEALEQKFLQHKIENASIGTVHAFQGDEKDEIIFSLAITNKTTNKTYDWLKGNKELINVGVSRAKKRLIILGSEADIKRLHTQTQGQDDIYELIEYAKTNGESVVSSLPNKSRALGIKPYSSEIEEAFLANLNHCLGNIIKNDKKCEVRKEVAIASIFTENINYSSLFYSGRFDFVVFEHYLNQQIPLLAIELDGKEHLSDEVVKRRDKKKNDICAAHGFELIRIDNSYARRYNYMKEILIDYFES